MFYGLFGGEESSAPVRVAAVMTSHFFAGSFAIPALAGMRSILR
jgi:hypothetical protein